MLSSHRAVFPFEQDPVVSQNRVIGFAFHKDVSGSHGVIVSIQPFSIANIEDNVRACSACVEFELTLN